MLTQAEARMYLQSQRGHYQTAGFRSFRTFNFEDYQASGREPVGALEVLNDETLLPECSHFLHVDQFCQIVLLPLVGAIEMEERGRESTFVNSGEALFLHAHPGENYTIINPYPDEAVNYLQIRITDNTSVNTPLSVLPGMTSPIDLTETNTLRPVRGYKHSSGHLFIGRFDGRREGIFTNPNPSGHTFIFVIQGAFEVQNRLLETRDGLALTGVEEIEFEALSNEAIVLVVAGIGG